jgi:4-carboxymuconolactone decarboxylase
MAELDAVAERFPRFLSEAAHLLTETLYEEAALDRRTIELILCSLLAGRRWELGVRTHVGKALEHGATPDEVRGAILLSFAVFGFNSAGPALDWADAVIREAGTS